MNSKNYKSNILLCLILIVSAFIGYNSLYPSKPNYDDKSKVNVKNQIAHINEISKEPHSIYDIEAKQRVQKYLISELNKLGVDTKLYEYKDVYVKRSDSKEDLQNIYGEIKGKSDSYIMLVTHYDSARANPNRYAQKDKSFGAADAGYGLSTILETLRVIKESNIELENGIKILITDGEEYGLLGAKESVKEKEIFDGVNYLINLEARGTKGPAIMFETSPNNSSIVDLYKSTDKSFSYSITPEIYRLLPNDTDFTVFLDNNIPGINISALDGLENYHTPNDSVENINEKSLQHYGDQVLPIVSEFVTNKEYSNPSKVVSNDDSIFFSLGSVFVKYSKIVNYVLLATILLSLLFLFKQFKIKKVSKVFKYSLINLLFTVIIMAVSYLITRGVAIINGRDFELTYLPLMKFEGIIILAVICLTFALYMYVIGKFIGKFNEKNEFILGSITLLLALSIIITIALPGASYLMVFPTLLLSIFTIIKVILERNIKFDISYIMLIPIALIIILYVPTIYLFNCALTFGALSVNMLFVMIGFISLLPCMLSVKGIFINRK